MEWTNEQRSILEASGSNILVSAAAGSGKTAVLVERIIRMVTDETSPLDIDRILVVTFTNAAAAQMKEKINDALIKKLEEDPSDQHIAKQIAGINRANIMTIDSFCLRVVKENFHVLAIDPNFSIEDNEKLGELKRQAMDETLEEAYRSDNADFITFVKCFGGDKNDQRIEDEIRKVVGLSDSAPEPLFWLSNAKASLELDTIEKVEESPWFKSLVDSIHEKMKSTIFVMEDILRRANRIGAADKFIEHITAEKGLMENVLHSNTYKALKLSFEERVSGTIRYPKSEEYDEEIKLMKSMRTKALDTFKAANCFTTDEDELLSVLSVVKQHMSILIELSKSYSKRLLELKKENNIFSFSDIEHFAYQVLVEDGKPTKIADAYRDTFYEIMIDEYQDSNLLQEEILSSLSGQTKNSHNVFMVGDVKQSIYKFRMSRPELFMEKYDAYKDGNDDYIPSDEPPYKKASDSLLQGIKLELHNNFRSRAVVLEAVNYIFYQLMTANLGGCDYDESVRLVPGLKFPSTDKNVSVTTELCVIDEEDEDSEDEALQAITKAEREAAFIASRINQLVGITGEDPLYISDRNGGYKKASYGDIAILLRSRTEFLTFSRVLEDAGIPVACEKEAGFFNTVEIRTLLSYLVIIDNPYSDIELVAVLHSPLYGFTNEELGSIRVNGRNMNSFYEALINYDGDKELLEKIKDFLDDFNDLKEKGRYYEVSVFISYLLKKTGYLSFLKGMDSEKRRLANVDYLISSAKKFTSGGHYSLFEFINYVNGMKDLKLELGEANLVSEGDDVVSITTMHKSKGLEFPIVFVSQLGKKIDKRDATPKIIAHNDWYLASKYVYEKPGPEKETLMRKAFAEDIVRDSISEELRVLYVALTRAKEKLIMTGSSKDYDKMVDSYRDIASYTELKLPYGRLIGASTFLDMITMAFMRQPDFMKANGISASGKATIDSSRVQLLFTRVRDADIKRMIAENLLSRSERATKLDEKNRTEISDQELLVIEERLNYRYPHEAATEMKTKYSVSELKDAEEDYEPLPDIPSEVLEKSKPATVPDFLKEKDASGAKRGTLYHLIMELIDFSAIEDIDSSKREVKKLLESGRLPEETKKLVKLDEIYAFFGTDLSKEMIAAAKKGKLKKESQFVMETDIRDIYPDCNEDERVLIQGIIDAWFIDEQGEIVVVDYKSDRGELPLDSYRKQIDYYAKTLGRLYGKEVKRKYIYSFKETRSYEIKEG